MRPFTGHVDIAGMLAQEKATIERIAWLAADGNLFRFEAFIAKRLPIPPNVIYFHAGFAAIATLTLALGLRQGVRWSILLAALAC